MKKNTFENVVCKMTSKFCLNDLNLVPVLVLNCQLLEYDLIPYLQILILTSVLQSYIYISSL